MMQREKQRTPIGGRLEAKMAETTRQTERLQFYASGLRNIGVRTAANEICLERAT